MRRLPASGLAILILLASAGCGSGRFLEQEQLSESKKLDELVAETRKDIALLAKGKDHRDIEASATYSEARDRIWQRGSKVEPTVIAALGKDPDWSVRLGLVEVLQHIGSKASVDALIGVLDDPQPLVALQADMTLRAMFRRSEIPPRGASTGANGLPPIPERDESDLELDAETRLWAEWHKANGARLKAAWAAWWQANRSTASVEATLPPLAPETGLAPGAPTAEPGSTPTTPRKRRRSAIVNPEVPQPPPR
jgi:HEAT repeat protein